MYDVWSSFYTNTIFIKKLINYHLIIIFITILTTMIPVPVPIHIINNRKEKLKIYNTYINNYLSFVKNTGIIKLYVDHITNKLNSVNKLDIFNNLTRDYFNNGLYSGILCEFFNCENIEVTNPYEINGTQFKVKITPDHKSWPEYNHYNLFRTIFHSDYTDCINLHDLHEFCENGYVVNITVNDVNYSLVFTICNVSAWSERLSVKLVYDTKKNNEETNILVAKESCKHKCLCNIQ